MTDETFPHEIWADLDHWIEGPAASDLRAQGYMKYTRTDRANELVAAAYEAAALECERAAYSGEYPQNDAIELGCLRSRDFIRRLTPTAAVAALAARDARIREAALREAVECAKTRQRMLGQVSPEAALALLDALPDAIEALIAKDKANG